MSFTSLGPNPIEVVPADAVEETFHATEARLAYLARRLDECTVAAADAEARLASFPADPRLVGEAYVTVHRLGERLRAEAEADVDALIASVHAQADRIVQDARTEADRIIAEARAAAVETDCHHAPAGDPVVARVRFEPPATVVAMHAADESPLAAPVPPLPLLVMPISSGALPTPQLLPGPSEASATHVPVLCPPPVSDAARTEPTTSVVAASDRWACATSAVHRQAGQALRRVEQLVPQADLRHAIMELVATVAVLALLLALIG